MLKKLMSTEYSTEIHDLLENIHFSSTTINNLVNDLLDLAKMEQNNFQFNEGYFDFIQSLTNSVDQQKFLSEKKGITMTCSFKSKLSNKQKQKDALCKNESYLSLTESIDIDDDQLSILNCILGDRSRYIQIL